MKIIFKYLLSISDQVLLYLPEGAKILSVQGQADQLVLWAIVDTSKSVEPRMFSIYGTGNPFQSDNARYIGTAQVNELVWHVFEEPIGVIGL
jgi:hypothetical protein